jgi:hypothetical protein
VEDHHHQSPSFLWYLLSIAPVCVFSQTTSLFILSVLVVVNQLVIFSDALLTFQIATCYDDRTQTTGGDLKVKGQRAVLFGTATG